MPNIPKKVFFTRGIGRHREKLQSFEYALRDAGIEKFNLVRISSIYPARCKIISKESGLKLLQAGQIVHVVLADNQTNEPYRRITSSIGLAVPSEKEHYGYLSEHHAFGETEKLAGDYAEDLAATMLASTLGIPFDPDTAYDERRAVYKMSGKIVKTRNITQMGIGDRNGLWTTAVAVAVFI